MAQHRIVECLEERNGRLNLNVKTCFANGQRSTSYFNGSYPLITTLTSIISHHRLSTMWVVWNWEIELFDWGVERI